MNNYHQMYGILSFSNSYASNSDLITSNCSGLERNTKVLFMSRWKRSKEVSPSWILVTFTIAICFWSLINPTLLYSELMMLGFLSMLLTVFQGPLSKICISQNAASTWHPCSNPKAFSNSNATSATIDRKLLQYLDHMPRRVLAAKGYDKCADKASWKFY